jgi:hypothetical protein
MPKRWKITSGSKRGFELWDTDTNKLLAKSVGKNWNEDEDVDDMVEEFRKADIEFSNGDVRPPRGDRS